MATNQSESRDRRRLPPGPDIPAEPNEPAPRIPFTARIHNFNRLDLIAFVVRVAHIKRGGIAEFEIHAVMLPDGTRTTFNPPHRFIQTLQTHNYYATIPQASAKFLGISPKSVVTGYVQRRDF